MLAGYHIAAVCLSCLHEGTLQDFISTYSRRLAENGWRALYFTIGSAHNSLTPSVRGEESVFDLIDPQIVDAIVIFGDKIKDEDCLTRIAATGNAYATPVFLINGHHFGCHSVNYDFAEGFSSVVRHLIEQHDISDFHLIAGPKGDAYSEERIRAMRGLLAEYGIPLRKEDISYGDFWSAPAVRALRNVQAKGKLPRAIVCANDDMAIAVTAELIGQGYRVPEDYVVTGFDGIEDIYYADPQITSAACDYGELGECLADLCIRAGAGRSIPEETKLRPKLIAQGSCGCHHPKKPNPLAYISHKNDVFNSFHFEYEQLGEVTSRLQSCTTYEEITEALHHPIFYSAQCLLKRECIDRSLDPMTQHSGTSFGEELYVLLDSDHHETEGQMIRKDQLALHMDALLQTGYPLFLAALHNGALPLGYFVFSYQSYGMESLLKIHQDALIIGPAIQAFRSRLYQEHLKAVVEQSYMYDSLTGLLGRNAFLNLVKDVHMYSFEPRTVVLVDMDGLKYINDHFSHSEGDHAIFMTATALHEVCRELCCRYGGDEMVALLNYAADEAELRQAIIDYLARYNESSGKPYQISASIGIYTSSDEDFHTMLSKADALMYQDKSTKPHRKKEA